MKNLIIASTSTLHGEPYLEYLLKEVALLYKDRDQVLFIPFARPGGISHEAYTEFAAAAFLKINIVLRGIHEFDDPVRAVQEADGIFTGGGNTFLLVAQLYKYKLMDPLATVVKNGTPYLGTSAGSNIAGLTMQTTNDMPIVYPPSFQTLGLLPFNLNPHYLDPDPTGTHMGESRETRIREFHQFNSVPVVGLREGSWLAVKNEQILLKGGLQARLFRKNQEPQELTSGSDISEIGRK